MRSIFSKLGLVSAMMATTMVAPQLASAQILNVPFNFTVAGKLYPAGQYSVERKDAGAQLVTMTSRESRASFHWTIGPGDPQPADDRIVLNFDNNGSEHTLRSVQYGPLITRDLSKHAKHDRERVAPGE